MPGQRQQAIARGFEHMRPVKPVAGWMHDPGSHSALDHAQESEDRQRKLLGNGVGWGHGTDAEARGRGRVRKDLPETQAKLGAFRDQQRALSEGAVFGDGKGERMGHSPGWRARLQEDVQGATEPVLADRNKRSVWTLPTEGYKEAHFATFPTSLVEPCILAGSPEGGNVLDCFGGSGITGLVADRFGRNATLCELNPSYAALADKRLAGDVGHVKRQRGLELEGELDG